jgi:hypothetical protein
MSFPTYVFNLLIDAFTLPFSIAQTAEAQRRKVPQRKSDSAQAE